MRAFEGGADTRGVAVFRGHVEGMRIVRYRTLWLRSLSPFVSFIVSYILV